MKRPLLILIAVICVIIGCQIDKTGIPVRTSNHVLSDSTWYLKSEIVSGTFAGFAVETDTITSFTTKDYYKFNTDFTVKISGSNTSGIATNYYSYNSSASGQTIIIGDAGTPAGINYVINKLTKDSLVIYNTLNQTSAGVNVVTNTTLKFTH